MKIFSTHSCLDYKLRQTQVAEQLRVRQSLTGYDALKQPIVCQHVALICCIGH